ncbi:hypothetical protein RYA05_00595 [Pseudomonas syringae pv. actinidiae]|nr:hypothetical protein [Pseudomonas syringae pv. actinidiae]
MALPVFGGHFHEIIRRITLEEVHMSSHLSPIAQRHILKAEITRIAVAYSEGEAEMGVTVTEIEQRLKQWDALNFKYARTQEQQDLIDAGGHDHLHRTTLLPEPVGLGLNGKNAIHDAGDLDDLCDAAEAYAGQRDSVLLSAILKTFSQEAKLLQSPSAVDFASGIEALIQKRGEIVAEFAALGLTTINRKMVVESYEHGEDVDLRALSVDRRLEEVVDVDERSNTIYYPSSRSDLVFEVVKEQDLLVRSVAAIPEVIPGYKDFGDYQRVMQGRKKLGIERSNEPSM